MYLAIYVGWGDSDDSDYFCNTCGYIVDIKTY